MDDKETRMGFRTKDVVTSRLYVSSARPRVPRELRSLGYQDWSEKYGYVMRWAAESRFYVENKILGESVMAEGSDLMYREVMAKFDVTPMLLQMS